MKKWILVLCILPFTGIGYAQDWKNSNLQELDKEQFRRLESGDSDLEEIPKLILAKSDKKPSKYVINAYTVLGILNKKRGYYVSSLNYNLLALSAAERLKDEGRISACLNNIGILYLLQENYPKAIDYFEKSLKLEEKIQNQNQKSIRLYNLGDAYKHSNQLDAAMGYYTASLLIEKKTRNKVGIAYALLGQADVYLQMKRNSDVASTLNEIVLNDLDDEGKVEYYKIVGEKEAALGNYKEALAAVDLGIAKANLSESKSMLAALYYNQAKLHEKLGDFQRANSSFKRHIEVYKSLQSNVIKNQLEDLTYQKSLQQKEYQIVYLKKQRELAAENAEAQKRLRAFDWRIALFSMASLIAIVVTVVFGIKRIVARTK